MTDRPRLMRGARPTPRHLVAAARPHAIVGTTPSQYGIVPATLSYWYNNIYGDCTTAEEAFAKAAYSVAQSQPELVIPDPVVFNWAAANGFLYGAWLPQVMHAMALSGFALSNGNTCNDGPYAAVDYTNNDTLCNAIYQGPVKICISADQLEAAWLAKTPNPSNGWFLLNASHDTNYDHCTSLCGFGTLDYLAGLCGVSLPGGANGSALGYLMFTWSSVGIIDQTSLLNICCEAWLRSPTTVIAAPPPFSGVRFVGTSPITQAVEETVR